MLLMRESGCCRWVESRAAVKAAVWTRYKWQEHVLKRRSLAKEWNFVKLIEDFWCTLTDVPSAIATSVATTSGVPVSSKLG